MPGARLLKGCSNGQLLSAPILLAAAGFCSGIVFERFCWRMPALLLLAFAASALGAWLASRRSLPVSLVACLLMFAVAGAWCAEVWPQPSAENFGLLGEYSHQNKAGRKQAADDEISGVVRSASAIRLTKSQAPYARAPEWERTQQVELEDVKVNGSALPTDYGIRLSLYAPAEQAFTPLGCAARVRWTGALHALDSYRDPGVWNSAEYFRQQSVGATASLQRQRLNASAGSLPWRAEALCRMRRLQQTAAERLIAYAGSARNASLWRSLRLTHEDAAMVTAMVTGDRAYLTGVTRAGFERTGSFHLLVVSGLHLAIFSGLAFWAARRLRMGRTGAAIATIAVSFLYAVFTGWGQPVERSFWMVSLYLLARLIWREKQSLNAIGAAALVLLAVRPMALFDTGFQMTLLAVMAVAGIAAPWLEGSFGPYLRATKRLDILRIDMALEPRLAQFRVTLRMLVDHLRPWLGNQAAVKLPILLRLALQCAELLVVTIAMEFAMAAPMAVSFHRVTAAGLPVNFLVIPMVGTLLPLAIATVACAAFAPAIAALPAAATAGLLHVIAWLVQFFGRSRLGDLRVAEPLWWQLAVWLGLLIAALFLLRLPRRALAWGTSVLILGIVILLWPVQLRHDARSCEIDVIDVGQGDSILVITPEGKTLLVDAGGLPGASPDARFDMGEDVVSAALWQRGVRRLDAVAITHAHLDHIGGMPAVIRNFKPRELWIGNNPHSVSYDTVIAEAQGTGVAIRSYRAGDAFAFGGMETRVLAPAADYVPAKTPENNDSLVLRMRYGKTSALLEGDAEAPSERRMLTESDLQADFLKVGHHGSRTSTIPEFLAAVRPQFAAISVGARNLYGHPRVEVLHELQQTRVTTYRTDEMGMSRFLLDGSRVWPVKR